MLVIFSGDDPTAQETGQSCPVLFPGAAKNDAVPKQSVAILYRNPSDLTFIDDVFGERVSVGISPMSSQDPSDLNQVISTNPVRSCFVMLTAEDLKKDNRYTELLKTAQSTVGKTFVVSC